LLIARLKHHPSAFDFDTDHSIQPIDLKTEITTAGSGSDYLEIVSDLSPEKTISY